MYIMNDNKVFLLDLELFFFFFFNQYLHNMLRQVYKLFSLLHQQEQPNRK